MLLDQKHKKLILDKGSKVYESYALMYMFKNRVQGSYKIADEESTLQQYFSSVLAKVEPNENSITVNPKINGKNYKFQLDKQGDGSWKLKLEGKIKADRTLKELDKYDSDDIVSLLGTYNVSFSRDRDNNLLISTEIKDIKGRSHILGGDKLDLHSIHISNIYNMLEYLKNPKLDPNMLISMATGSGKSITQALWFLVLFLGDIPAFFGAPDAVCKAQLRDEFAATLPYTITEHLDSKDDKFTEKLPRWGIFTHHELLQEKFAELSKKEAQKCFVVIDEQHEAMREEIYSARVKLLAKSRAFMFLSATPTKAAYELSNNQAVSNFSTKDKERLAISKSVKIKSGKPENLDKKMKRSKATFSERLTKGFVDSIEPERTSPANEYYDMLKRVCHFRQKEEKFYADIQSRTFESDEEKARFLLRWNYQTPYQKSLILISDHDIMVNLSLLSRGDGKYVYKNGNKVARSAVYGFFMLGDNIDEKYANQHRTLLDNMARENVSRYLKEHALEGHESLVDFVPSETHNEYNVLHGIIGNTLTFLTDYDEARLDYERFHDLDKLTKLVKDKVGNVTQDEIKEYLRKDGKLPESVVNEISAVMFEVVEKLQSASDAEKKLIVDNWNMDSKLHGIFSANEVIDNFIQKYKTIFVMNGLENSNSKVKSNKPFFDLKEKTIKLHTDTGINPDAPQHKLSSIEALDDYIDQYIYEPNYCNDEMTDKVVVQMFKKGLIGSLITSEKVTGFNDKNLHNTALLLGSNQDHLNRPDKIVQAAGRNRGSNPARQPFFMLCVDDKAVMSFDPANLDKKDIFPDFYRSKEKSYQILMREIGSRIADKMRDWLDHNMTAKGDIDSEEFSNQALDFCLEEFEKLYNENGHSFDKTRSDFKYILADLYKELARENENVKKSNALPKAALIIAEITNAILQMLYTFASISSYVQLKRLKSDATLTANQKTYINIIDKFVFAELVEAGTVLLMMKKKLESKLTSGLSNDLALIIKQEKIDELDNCFKDYIAPYLMNMIKGEEHQKVILEMLLKDKNWVSKLDVFREMAGIVEEYAKGQNKENLEAFEVKLIKLLKSDKKISSYMRLHNVEINVETMLEAYESIKKVQEELQKTRKEKMRTALGMEGEDEDFEKAIDQKIVDPFTKLAESERARITKLQAEVTADIAGKVEEVKGKNKASGMFGAFIPNALVYTVRLAWGMTNKDVNEMFVRTIVPSIQKFLTEQEANALREVFPENGNFITNDKLEIVLNAEKEITAAGADPKKIKKAITELLSKLSPKHAGKIQKSIMKDFPYSTVHEKFNDHFHNELFPVLYSMMDGSDKNEFEIIINKYQKNWGKAAVDMADGGEALTAMQKVAKIAKLAITDEKDREKALDILNKYIDEKQVATSIITELFEKQFENILLLLPANYRHVIHKDIDVKSLEIRKAIEKWQLANPAVDVTSLFANQSLLFSFVIDVIIEAAPGHKQNELRSVLNKDFAKEAFDKFGKIRDDMARSQDPKKKTEVYAEYVDVDKANKFIHDMSASYFFEQKLLLKQLKKVFDKLSNKDLENILRVKDCKDPEKEAEEIKQFLKDMGSMNTEAFFEKYGRVGNDLKVEEVPLVKIIEKAITVFGEVTDAKCYFDGMDRKGNHNKSVEPALKKNDKDAKNSKVWEVKSFDKLASLSVLSNKTKFLKGTIEGLKKLGTVDEIHHGKRSRHMEDSAKHLVLCLEHNLHNDTLYDKVVSRARNFFYNLFSISVSAENIVMQNSAKQVASELNAARSFSRAEVEDDKNPHKNAVARTRRGWEEKVASRRVEQGPENTRNQ